MKITNFIPVTGQELYDQMYDKEHNYIQLETVIEDIYKMGTYRASNMQVSTIKRGFYGSREQTDGYMTFSLNGEEKFYGIQEVKRKVCNKPSQYKKQLLQALRYLWLYRNDPSIKVFVLNSEKFYVYVLRKDIENLIEQLNPLFAASKEPAYKSWKDINLQRTILNADIPFHTTLLKDLRLDNALKEIYAQAA